jgi:peptide/nickel transport system permease protein
MWAYMIRRLLVIPFMLLAMSFFVFLLLFIKPGSAAFATSGQLINPVQIAALEKELGLDKPFYVQYGKWLGNAVQGDFGKSLRAPRDPVINDIKERIGNTIELGVLTVLLSAILGISIGALSAVRRNSWIDWTLRMVSILGISVPNFWTATLLVCLPAMWWGWTPLAREFYTLWDDPLANLSILIWPAAILAYGSAAYTARIVRSSMLEVLYSDYIRTARAKGLTERVVVIRHVLRNSLVTLLTVVGLQLGAVLGGSVIVERIFAIPGLGVLTLEAVMGTDFPVVLATVMMFALLFVFLNLVVDLLYTVVDPRIRY